MSNLARFSSIASRRGPVARSSSLERTTRQRTAMFLPEMDIGTRLGPPDDIPMTSRILDSITNRDFYENDYEMLFSLDRGVNHGGASGSQINGLPQSTVESDLEEACAICLETPIVGNTIRHLPCLHKFHKDLNSFSILKFDSVSIRGWGREPLVQFASYP